MAIAMFPPYGFRLTPCGSRLATLAMVHKLAIEAEKHWRKLNGYELLTKVIGGVRFEDGVEVAA